jgi:hypothetical protein
MFAVVNLQMHFIVPNKWLQATWPRLSERTINCGLYFPAKMVIEMRKSAKRLSHQPLGHPI